MPMIAIRPGLHFKDQGDDLALSLIVASALAWDTQIHTQGGAV